MGFMMNTGFTQNDIFFALGEPRRRAIVEMLAEEGRMSSTDISMRFKVSAPAISQHLKVLKEANVVKVEKKAQQRIYELNPEAMDELQAWVKRMTKLWNERFDKLDLVLEGLKKTYKETGFKK